MLGTLGSAPTKIRFFPPSGLGKVNATDRCRTGDASPYSITALLLLVVRLRDDCGLGFHEYTLYIFTLEFADTEI